MFTLDILTTVADDNFCDTISFADEIYGWIFHVKCMIHRNRQ